MNLPQLRRRLLAWFDRNRRDLPWRHNRDPYRIWVSEVMLQQTTVAAVIPYFERFMAAFPTLSDLASASEHDVLRHWEGLGYYRRARHLHQASRQLVGAGSSLPDDPDVWGKLPGVGRYILGAVLSQAFDRRMPIVEANSQRVLCRLFAERRDPKSSAVQSWLWDTATAILPRSRAGDFNQAMMELGALICTPKEPKCGECPIRAQCLALEKNLQHRIPAKSNAKKPTPVSEVALVIRRRNRVLLAQLPDNALRWAGMWEFPRTELQVGETCAIAARRLLKDNGLKGTIASEIMTIRHGVTRFRITLVALECNVTGGKFASKYYVQGQWLAPSELTKYPVAMAQRRLANAIKGDTPNP